MQYIIWVVIAYLVMINIITFIVFGVDKAKAKSHSWRIPEKTLFLLALVGGSIGAIIGMHTFRHKTRKWYFVIGMPLILVAQLAVAWAFGVLPGQSADAPKTAVESTADANSANAADANASAGDTTSTRGRATAADIPAYNGDDVLVLDDDQPAFTAQEKQEIRGESFSELDALGRCGVAVARLHESMMPTEKRGAIGHIRPSGWHTVKYPDLIKDRYLFNRSHLIAHAMTGQNDNEKNLITGTRHMNAELMLPYERRVIEYLEDTGNHVLYRVTPRFKGDELVARGVEMEAWSVEDEGEGLAFHVFLYNVQPGIQIDYKTGESKRA
ncbi:MAG: DUF1294 domain-containing protein [Eubacterium sp.]|nr:DUF1294 domain-containing protein [Eubacterium sp.]